MTPGKWANALKGISGEYELGRLVGLFGGIAYTICANVFVAYEVIWRGKDFDVTAYCLAFPSGVAAIATGTAVGIAIKDRNVASSKVISQTGAVPTPALDGAKLIRIFCKQSRFGWQGHGESPCFRNQK